MEEKRGLRGSNAVGGGERGGGGEWGEGFHRAGSGLCDLILAVPICLS